MEYIVRTNTCELSCRLLGEGEPLLLIHGASCDSSYFEEAAELLKKTFRVITYDRRGYRNSKASPDADFSIEEQAGDAVMALEGAGFDAAGVAGCSAGGAVALEMAYRFPHKVQKLFLHEPPIPGNQEHEKEIREWLLRLGELAGKRRICRALQDFSRTLGGTDPQAGSMTLQHQAQNLENLKVFLYRELEGLTAYCGHMPEDMRLKMPCILAAGADDEEGLFSKAGPLSAERLGCTFARVPGYHNLAFERPQVFADILTGAFSYLFLK